MAPYCSCPAGLRLDNTGSGLAYATLDLMDDANGFRVDSFDPGFPTVREVVAANPTQPGEYDYTTFFGPRAITVTGTLVPSANQGSRQGALAELNYWCQPGVYQSSTSSWVPFRPRLIYCIDPDQATMFFTVRGSQLSAPVSDAHFTAFTVSWVAADPTPQPYST